MEPSRQVDHYGAQYGHFRSALLAAVRREAFGEDYGQNGWQTADEHERFVDALALGPDSRLLDVACGSGGPALRFAARSGCSVVGIDLHEDGVATARASAAEALPSGRAAFERVDAGGPLPFEDRSFDAVVCVDAINHLPDRARVLAEWARVLKPGGRLLYTDPIVVTGWLTDEEMRVRSSIGFFLFFPAGANERLVAEAGLELLAVEDRTANVAATADRWRRARDARADELRRVEGEATFAGQQTFLEVAARLAREGRLSRTLFLARKGAGTSG